MASEGVAVIRHAVEAVVRGDREGFIALLTPDVEWDDHEGWANVRRVYHGRAGARNWWDAFMRVGGEVVSAEIEEIADAGANHVLLGVLARFRGRADGTRTEFNARAWYVFTLRDEKISRAQLFWIRSEAYRAAGLLE
jgi:ketosteroid isomerase-like protein